MLKLLILKLLLLAALLLLSWPLALAALVFYPFVWMATLPLRLAGVALTGPSAPAQSAPQLYS